MFKNHSHVQGEKPCSGKGAVLLGSYLGPSSCGKAAQLELLLPGGGTWQHHGSVQAGTCAGSTLPGRWQFELPTCQRWFCITWGPEARMMIQHGWKFELNQEHLQALVSPTPKLMSDLKQDLIPVLCHSWFIWMRLLKQSVTFEAVSIYSCSSYFTFATFPFSLSKLLSI